MLSNCFCGIAQIHNSYCGLRALRQREVDKLLVWDRPDACLVMCVTRDELLQWWRPDVCFVVVVHLLRQCQANEG